MFKKNSWIAALLVALALTASIIGCVNPLAVEEDTETYEEYVLDKGYNAWAGQVYQSGWAIGGIAFQGKGDAIVIAKDLGYDVEMFQRARYLEIEMPDETYPRSGVDIIWGGEDAAGSSAGIGMWNQQPIAGGSGDVDTTFAKKDGNKLRIDLTKALKNYSNYKAASTAKVKIVLQVNAPSYGNVEGLVKKATLLIPNTPPPSVGVGNVFLMSNEMYWTNDFVLEAEVVPADATNQSVVWAIQDWTPAGSAVGGANTLKLPKLDLSDPTSVSDYETAKTALLAKVNWKQEEYTTDNGVYPNTTAYRNIPGVISVPLVSGVGTASLGTVRLTAIIKNGKLAAGNFSDYEKSNLMFTIKDPPLFVFKVGGVDQKTIWYGAVDNKGGGASGGKMEVTPTAGVTPAEGTSFTSTFGPGGGYANSRHYIEVNLGAGKKLSDFSKITLHYKGVDEKKEDGGNLAGKSIRLRAAAEKPTTTSDYNFGAYISTTSFPGGYADGWDTDIEFVLFEDNALNSDGDTKNGIYRKGVGADLRLAATDAGNAASYDLVKDESVVYIWILPWNGGKTTFEISDVKFIAK
jgi:hypothetical protein